MYGGGPWTLGISFAAWAWEPVAMTLDTCEVNLKVQVSTQIQGIYTIQCTLGPPFGLVSWVSGTRGRIYESTAAAMPRSCLSDSRHGKRAWAGGKCMCLCMCAYVYIYMYMCKVVYLYMHT